MTPRFDAIASLLLLVLATGCGDKQSRTGNDSVAPAKAAPAKAAPMPQTGSLLLLPWGRGMLVADSTEGGSCRELQKAMVGKVFASGGARFKVTGLGPDRDPALPAVERISDEVLLYKPIGPSSSARPDVTVFPPRPGADEKKSIRWARWDGDSLRPDRTMKAAFRRAVRPKVPSKHVSFRQRVEVNVSGKSTDDVLIVASADYPQCRFDEHECRSTGRLCDPPDWCDEKDNWWLLLVPDGRTSKAVVLWAGQREETLSIFSTYDLDGDGVHAVRLGYSPNPNEGGHSYSATIRDDKLHARCRK